jgi:methionyl-tRNA formyltransferase
LRVVAFVNNIVGLAAIKTIQNHGDQIVAVVVHTQAKSSLRSEILAAVDDSSLVIEGSQLRDQTTVDQISALNPDIGVSAFFGHILRPELISLFPNGIVNVHPSYLPYNRGAFPNVWAIAEGTPAGATVHFIDEGIDTGDIISQIEIDITPEDTGETLYRRLETACVNLFNQTWPKLSTTAGKPSGINQIHSESTSHRVKDTEKIDRIDLESQYTAGELINIIRARTFSGHKGAYFEQDGAKYYLRLNIDKKLTEGDNS